MPDVLLFGATGYTGTLVAHALAERGASFAIAGRNRNKLEALARAVGDPEVRLASADDLDGLVAALGDCRVLLTCVGPFAELGWTAVEAALRARVHYLDSAGEASFVGSLIERYDGAARAAGIALAPALGFDEVPGDVAATLATEGLDRPDLVLSYALPSSGSRGTVKSALGILASDGRWVRDGRPITIRAAQRTRWAPMPPPLGPKQTIAFPFASGHLVPLHVDVRSLELYVTIGTPQRLAAAVGVPALRATYSIPGVRAALHRAVETIQRVEGPEKEGRAARWTVLAEARADERWKNVGIQGRDVYGLSAKLLATAALEMTEPGYDRAGVLAPVQAVDPDVLEKTLLDEGCSIQSYGPGG